MPRYYAGIGSRETPAAILARMTALAAVMRAKGYTLRSGGAAGADSAFARGAGREAVVYVPWRGFPIEDTGARVVVCGDDERLREITVKHHPNWRACGHGARALHTRNVAQILGSEPDDPLSELVICWTPGGRQGGGTGQALRIAATYGIDIYDLAQPGCTERLTERLAQ